MCVLYPLANTWEYKKTHKKFNKYRIKWKFISDPIYIIDRIILGKKNVKRLTKPCIAEHKFVTKDSRFSV